MRWQLVQTTDGGIEAFPAAVFNAVDATVNRELLPAMPGVLHNVGVPDVGHLLDDVQLAQRALFLRALTQPWDGKRLSVRTRSAWLRAQALQVTWLYRRSGSRWRCCTPGPWGDGRHTPGSSSACHRARCRGYRLCNYNSDNHTCVRSFSTPCCQVVIKRQACRLQAMTVDAGAEFKGQPIGKPPKFIYCTHQPSCKPRA